MSSRDLVPYGGGRESTRDLVPYGSGREPTQHGRQSTRDSRSHRTTTRGHTSHGDPRPYGSGRESTRRTERGSTGDSRSHRTATRGYTSHRDYSPSLSTSGSDRSPSRTLVRRDSRTNTNYGVTPGEYGRRSRHHNPVDEFAFSDDEGDLTYEGHLPMHPYDCACSRIRDSTVIAEYEVEELPGGGCRIIRELPVGGARRINNGLGDDSDGYTTRRTGSTRYPTTTGSSRHHTNTGSTRHGTMTSSRQPSHSTVGGYRSTHGESSRSTRR